MAFNNFFPANYQPYYPQQNYGVQQNQQNGPLIYVQGEAGAKGYLVAPNQTVVLWDAEAPVIYVKSADQAGIPNVRILDYTFRDNAPQKPAESAPSDFATKDDVESIKAEIVALRAILEPVKETKKEAK